MSKDVLNADIKITTINKQFLTICCDAHKLPFRSGVFDVVYASHVLEHVFNPLACLREMKRTSRNKVIIKIPKATLQTAFNENIEHVFTWSISSFSNFVSIVFSDFKVYPTRRLVIHFPILQQSFNRVIFWVLLSLSREKYNEITAICKVNNY